MKEKYTAKRNNEKDNKTDETAEQEPLSAEEAQAAEDQRSDENNAKNAKAALAVAKNIPVIGAYAHAIDKIDNLTGGKLTQGAGKVMTKANKVAPGGQQIQNASNQASESGASDGVQKIANAKSGGSTKSSTSSTSSSGSSSGKSSSVFSTNSSSITSNIMKGLGVKKYIVIGGVAFFFILMITTVVASKDHANLELTNNSTMTPVTHANAEQLGGRLQQVAKWYIDEVGVYDQTLYLQSPFTTSPVRADCTGFAVAYMSYVAGVDLPVSWSGEMIYPDGTWAQTVKEHGWNAYTSDTIGTLKTGDVLVAHSGALYSTKGQHAEIYVDENSTFGWGSKKISFPTSNTITTEVIGEHVHFFDGMHDYITIYRYEGATSNNIDISDIQITKINDSSFNHGSKSKDNQKYIMLHDTEMSQDAKTVVQSWKNSGSGVAAHFVIDRDGTIIQAVDLDVIAHHAGWGGPGNFDSKFGVGNNDGKGNGDDLVGTSKVGYSGYTSYGMNSYSVGIEMCHVNGETYPEAQLIALDKVIAYIDSYYGFQSEIIDHKAWRPSNSDTDINFYNYLNNYKKLRHH